MKRRLCAAWMVWWWSWCLCGAAWASPELTLTAVRVGGAAVGEPLKAGEQIAPGDTVEYRATYVNRGTQPAQGLSVTLPVPQPGFIWLPGEPGRGAPASASLDGQRFEPLPLMRTELLPDGRRVRRAVPVAEYRFLRWQLADLPAGGVHEVRARMQLAPLAAASAP